MDYEIVNVLQPTVDNWKAQKERLESKNGQLITLSPDPSFASKKFNEFENAINVVDYVTGRTYDAEQTLFFDKLPTVDGAEIFMNEDGTISIISDGDVIGEMRIFPNTRRLVKDVTYFNADGTKDYVEEYTSDGSLFSNIYYFDDKIEQMAFFDNAGRVHLHFYLYEGSINSIIIEDPETGEVMKTFDNINSFFAAILAEIIKPEDTVGISYMGVELSVVSRLQSENTLYLNESVFDDNQNIKGNLKSIMDNNIPWIQKVIVSKGDLKALNNQNKNTNKLIAE